MQDKSHKVGYGQSPGKAKLGKNAENRIIERINSTGVKWVKDGVKRLVGFSTCEPDEHV